MSDVDASSLRVLVVEDEPLVSMLLEDMLTDAGYGVAGCMGNVAQALKFAREHSETFDFAILDVNLAGEPIFPVAEALTELGKPFAFATGYGAGGLPDKWRGQPTLQKPFSGADVEQVLSDARRPG